MPRAADMLAYRTPQQFGSGQTIDRSIPMATPSGEFIPTPPTESQVQWEGALSNPSIANILYGAGEAAMSVLTSPAPYVAGMVGYGYGALTGKDPKATGVQFEQAATIQPQTALGQYYTEQVGDKLSALPPVVSGIPTPRLGAGAARYAGQQYALPLAEKGLTMYEQGKLTPGMNPISEMGLFNTTGLPNRGADLIQNSAEKFAQQLRDKGFQVTLDHSGSRAGPSSYLRIYDPETGGFIPNIRMSGHSKGVEGSASVFNVATPEEMQHVMQTALDMRKQKSSEAMLAQKAENELARKAREEVGKAKMIKSMEHRLRTGKSLSNTQQEYYDSIK